MNSKMLQMPPATDLAQGQPRICPRCARGNLTLRLLRRPYSAAATTAAVTDASPPLLTPNRTPTAQPITHPKATHKLKAGIILTRAPLLTRALQPFETSFFLYQKRLHERLSAPFHAETYFKEDTAVALDWAIKLKERQGTPAKDIGAYRPQSRSLVRDEEEVGSTLDGEESIREALVLDAEVRVSEDGEEIPEAERVPVEPPRPRRTEADEKGDARRLDRELDRTLYLVVQGKDGAWGFPCADVLTSETLHEVCFTFSFTPRLLPVLQLLTPKLLDGGKGARIGSWCEHEHVDRGPGADCSCGCSTDDGRGRHNGQREG